MKTLRRTAHKQFYWMFFLLFTLAACNSAPATPPTPIPSSAYTPFDLGIPAEALNSPVIGNVDPKSPMHVTVLFKLNQSQQDQLQKISSGKQSLDPNKIGITDEQYQQVKKYLGIQNVKLTLDKLHTSVDADGTAQTMSRLFQTSFVNHKYQDRVFYAPKTAPLIPTQIKPYILSITGLDNYTRPVQTGISSAALRSLASQRTHRAQADCTPPPGNNLPQDISHSYGYDTLRKSGFTGKGITINLIEIDGYSQQDIENYGRCVGYRGKITVKTIGEEPAPLSLEDGEGIETALDIQMIQGLAPDADIVDYQTGNKDILSALKQIVNDNADNTGYGSIVSISLGLPENYATYNFLKAVDQQLYILTHVEHMTVFVASGDCAAYSDRVFESLSVSFPASDPNVVGVGGTILQTDNHGNRQAETVWSNSTPDVIKCNNNWGTGGGNSVHFQQPDWQKGKGVENENSLGFRQVPDVAAIAANLPIYFADQWLTTGGTSASAPIWAAGMALVNQATIQNFRSFYYGPQIFYTVANNTEESTPYTDITQGDNYAFDATTGWDYPTGWGSPNLVEFYNILAATSK